MMYANGERGAPDENTKPDRVEEPNLDSSLKVLEASLNDSEEITEKETSSSDSEEITEKETSSSDSEEITEKETGPSDSEEITEKETSSSDSEEEIIAADSEEIERGNSISDGPKEQKDRDNTLFSALEIQALIFSAFQGRAILFDLLSGSLSKFLHILVKQSQPFLLIPAVGTVGVEVGIRIKNLIHAPEEHAQMAREGLTTALIKAVTVSAFCLNALYEQIGRPDPRVAKAAGLLFSALIFLEMLISAKTSASLPSTNYMSIACFLDFFVKLFIFPSTIMQLSSDATIVLIGNIMAMMGFLAVMFNVHKIKEHLNSENSPPPSDEENGIISPLGSINIAAEDTPLKPMSPSAPRFSTNKQTFWGAVGDRFDAVPAYLGITEPRTDTIPQLG